MKSWWLAVTAALLCATGASAQDEPMWLRISGFGGASFSVETSVAEPSVADVTAQLRAAFEAYDNSEITAHAGVAQAGEEIAARDLGYQFGTARLGNDVSRLGARTPLLRAGAALYGRSLANVTVAQMLNHTGTLASRLWCGAAAEPDRNGRIKGYCLVHRRQGWMAAEVRADSPYAPGALGVFVPVTEAQISIDPEVMAELPARILSYRFESASGLGASVAQVLRVGETSIPFDTLRIQSSDGAAQLMLGTQVVRIKPAQEAGAAEISVGPPDAEDVDRELRRLAEAVVNLAERRRRQGG